MIGVRTGEIDKLENTGGRLDLWQGEMGCHPVLVDDDDFSRLDLPDELGLDQVQGAAFGGDHVGIPELAQAEGPEAMRVADGNHPGLGQEEEAIGTLYPVECVGEPFQKRAGFGGGKEVDDDLGIHGCLEDRTPCLQFILDKLGVDDIAVVGYGNGSP